MTYNTERRHEIIALTASERERAFTAEEICGRLLNDGNGKSTVYRIISNLVNEGILKRISDGTRKSHIIQNYGESVIRTSNERLKPQTRISIPADGIFKKTQSLEREVKDYYSIG